MFCNISGTVPQEPVVSKKSGHLFEKNLILKYLEEHDNKCPMTNEFLTADDLLEVKSKITGVKPRPVTATSIPGLLQMFQNEWEALMLETFTMKQNLNTAKQELSHTLYQHDAACRVISRLVKEKEESNSALMNLKSSTNVAERMEDVEEMGENAEQQQQQQQQVGLTRDVLIKLAAHSQELSSNRRNRAISPDLCTPESMSKKTRKSAFPMHPSAIRSVHNHSQRNLVVTAGEDGSAIVFNKDTSKVLSTLRASSRPLNSAIFHPTYGQIFTAGSDNCVKYWSLDNGSCITSLNNLHRGEVTGLTVHATGDYLASCSYDGSWAFCDISTGTALIKKKVSGGSFKCINFHPDGLIFGTGSADAGTVQIWDIKSQQEAAKFVDHKDTITGLSFSENGYYLASSSKDSTVRIWDLRKLTSVHVINCDSAVNSVTFDHSGLYLGFGCDDGSVNVYQSKVWNQLNSFSNAHDGPVSGVAFGKNASYLVSAGSDHHVKFYE